MMSELRREHDLLGERQLPADSLYGIHAARAAESFQLAGRRVHPGLIAAYGMVKLAALRANHALRPWPDEHFEAMQTACGEMAAGELDAHVVVDALQGGAGTSTNMNVNEVLTNRALVVLGRRPGDYATLHPIDDLNRHQSTNDTYPTALAVAAISELRQLQAGVVELLEAFQDQERRLADVVKVGRTQLQDAVLTTLGREMGAYAGALARDRWRLTRCEERLRVVPLGGTAIGTGLGAPRRYIFTVVQRLQEITGFGLARAEDLVDGVQNQDALVEVSGTVKALATTLLKVCGDLRLLSSGPSAGLGELRLPARQAGSSIMPGKVNPVIPEAVSQAAMRVMANDALLAHAVSMGSLELNPFGPLLADTLLESLTLLGRATRCLARNCVARLEPDRERCAEHVQGATATVTALVEGLGYEGAQAVAGEARRSGRSVAQVATEDGWLTPAEFAEAVAPERVMRLGSSSPTQPSAPAGPAPKEAP